jgi:predicted DNA binding protein
MATIIDFRVSPDDFALASTMRDGPSFRLTVEQSVTHTADSMIPFVWVTTSNFSVFEEIVAMDPSVDSLSRLTDLDTTRLYRIDWIEDITTVLQLLIGDGNVINSVQLNHGRWEFQLICPEHVSLSEIYSDCIEHGLSIDVGSIYELDSHYQSECTLTDLQYATLNTAKKMGYYEVPRKVCLTDLAEVLGVSHQALSERLRRAHGRLIEDTIKPVGKDQMMHSATLED